MMVHGICQRPRMVGVALLALVTAQMPSSALAQATPSADDAKAATIEADPGRPVPDARGGLAGRGGADAAGTEKTFAATIGSRIYSTIGTPIGSQLPAQPR
jgi:hypothetical protein